ncbi:hypothetical protein GK047_22705 [Paenibacillus sp. SYP-B3998]|uniref:Uncharacterized protein n=1 Tax=Paenibacillus sp. SYP-B3998 TaxID=2678564 RepID=A0A6G4A4R5_9BACL|nr:hypothetical protein [Paenibacillus sp. SYP-B3998]NEW08811.1 hypothetical protein [Paenibacillus sp. SYP-B3998]
MKPTLELQEIIVALGIDLERFRIWQQSELPRPEASSLEDKSMDAPDVYEMVF